MDWLNWYDLITPTNPSAGIFFGFISSLLVAIVMWIEMKDKKAVFITLLVGWVVTLVVVSFLYLIGFY